MENYHPKVQTTADVVEKWAANVVKRHQERRHLIIVGDFGIGKTRIAERLLEWIRAVRVKLWPRYWPKVPKVEFVEFGAVAFLETGEFKNWLADQSDLNHGTDILFLEDIGAEVDRFKSGEPTERLREIFNAFKGKWMVVTTNVPVDHWEARWDGRVMDRMFRNSVIADMSTVPSFQEVKASLPYKD